MSLLLGGLLGGGIGAGIGYANSRPGEGARGAVMGGLMGAGIGGGLGYGYSKAMPYIKKGWAADRAGRIASNKPVGGSVTQQVAKTTGGSAMSTIGKRGIDPDVSKSLDAMRGKPLIFTDSIKPAAPWKMPGQRIPRAIDESNVWDTPMSVTPRAPKASPNLPISGPGMTTTSLKSTGYDPLLVKMNTHYNNFANSGQDSLRAKMNAHYNGFVNGRR